MNQDLRFGYFWNLNQLNKVDAARLTTYVMLREDIYNRTKFLFQDLGVHHLEIQDEDIISMEQINDR